MILDGVRAQRLLRVLPGVAVLVSACAVMHLQAPDITPTAVELTDVQLNEQHFKVTLHVQNPNDRALPIKYVKCALAVEGVEIGRGESVTAFNVPAHGETDFDMMVTTNIASSVPDLLIKVARGGQLPSYRLSGTVNPDIAYLPPIPFSKSGTIQIPSQ